METQKTVTAKFKCTSTTNYEQNTFVELWVVTNGSEENKSFSKYTPSGSLTMTIDRGTEAHNYFQPGKEYYLEFTEAVTE